MKHKYRILEKHYEDGSVWFMPQVGDWWNGWRYIGERHSCPEVGLQRRVYRTFAEADIYMKDFIKHDTQDTTSSEKIYFSRYPLATKIHTYTTDCLS